MTEEAYSMGIECPACGHNKSKVFDSRTTPVGGTRTIRRRRRCNACGTCFSTGEVGYPIAKDVLAGE